MKSESFTLDSNLPYVLVFIAYRFPGNELCRITRPPKSSRTCSAASARICTAWCRQATRSPRNSGWPSPTTKASVGYAVVALPAAARRQGGARRDAQDLETYAQHGVPEDLVTAAKRREVADAEFERNSIPGLANVWSNALAAEGRASPDEDVAAIQR